MYAAQYDAVGGVSGYLDLVWGGIAVAARYGHQQLSEIKSMEGDELKRFNEQLEKLIEAENKRGSGFSGALATGG